MEVGQTSGDCLTLLDDEYLSKREFSFTKEDIYSRYNSFTSLDTMKARIIKDNPDKFDIGAVYNTSVCSVYPACSLLQPANHTKVSSFAPKEKELVFDIDATDYSDVFVATEKTTFITTLTWPIMAVAIQVLDDLLRNDFGFGRLINGEVVF